MFDFDLSNPHKHDIGIFCVFDDKSMFDKWMEGCGTFAEHQQESLQQRKHCDKQSIPLLRIPFDDEWYACFVKEESRSPESPREHQEARLLWATEVVVAAIEQGALRPLIVMEALRRLNEDCDVTKFMTIEEVGNERTAHFDTQRLLELIKLQFSDDVALEVVQDFLAGLDEYTFPSLDELN